MNLVEIKRATRLNLDDICRSLSMSKKDYDIMVQWYLNSSASWAGFYRDQIACIYGVQSATLLSDDGYLWLVTNELVKEHPFLFVRHSQIAVEKLLKEYKVVRGHVYARHPNSMQWLEWLGVKLKRHEVKNDLMPFDLERIG